MNSHPIFVPGTILAALFFASQPGFAQPFCPSPGVGAFTGCYYNNVSLTGNPAFVRTDNQINFNWGKGSPDASVAPSNFSARWAGRFLFDAGSYTFSAVTSDGIRIYLDGSLILDRWYDLPPSKFTASRTIEVGSHLVTVEYYAYNGQATAQVSWNNNTAPAASPPHISSFTATPAVVTPGQSTTLSWSASGATTLSIDNGVGDVSSRTTTSVSPNKATTYTLTALNSSGSVTASATISMGSQAPVDTQPPTVPTLISATGRNANDVDLKWSTSTDDTGVAGYTIFRNGAALTKLPATATTYADTAVQPNTVYTYSLNAYDAAGNFSATGNVVQAVTPGALPPPGNCPAPGSGVFTGCYYPNMTLSGNPAFVHSDPQINFYWGNAAPDPSLQPLNFSARWQGNFPFTGGTYLFTAIASDGMRLYLDGTMIMDAWRDQAPNQYRISHLVNAGNHLVVVEYYEHLGGATAQVSWLNIAPQTSGPVISSFTATPASVQAGQPVNLGWSVSGATAVSIDQGIGDVTGKSALIVQPVVTTTYTLTASNEAGTASANTKVTIAGGAGAPPSSIPTAPTLLSAIAITTNEADLSWSLSTSPIGIAGYQILRNGAAVGNVPSANNSLFYADTGLTSNATYFYTVKAYDPAGNYSAASNNLSVTTPAGGSVSVTWYGACWETATLYGVTGQYQAIDFALTTPSPAPLQGTLFFAPDCSDSNGTDNLNDFNTLTPSTHMIQGFSHHPDEIPTSALYWIGGRTQDGKCPAGAPCSRCVNYTKVTPKCESLP